MFAYFQNSRINLWDSFHYYVGAKYFSELGYFKLYECATLADSQDPAWNIGISNRTITNLVDNSHIRAREFLGNPERCLSKFTQTRWIEFKNDAKFFRDRMGNNLWRKALGDRGYNATPFFTAYASIIFNKVPLSEGNLSALYKVDFIFLFLALMLIMWIFGATSGGFVAILILNMPSLSPGWILGSLFRLDWFFFIVLSIIATKKESYLLAGFLLTLSIGMRLYPVIFLFGIILYSIHHYKEKTFLPIIKNFSLGILIGLIFILNLIVAQLNINSISESYQNLNTLQGTILTNKVGLKAIVGFDSEKRLELTFDKSKFEAHNAWREGLQKSHDNRQPIFLLLCGAFIFFLVTKSRNMDLVTCYISSLSLLIMLTPLNYYYIVFPLIVLLLNSKYSNFNLVLLPSIVGVMLFISNPNLIKSVLHQDIVFLIASFQMVLLAVITLHYSTPSDDKNGANSSLTISNEQPKGSDNFKLD